MEGWRSSTARPLSIEMVQRILKHPTYPETSWQHSRASKTSRPGKPAESLRSRYTPYQESTLSHEILLFATRFGARPFLSRPISPKASNGRRRASLSAFSISQRAHRGKYARNCIVRWTKDTSHKRYSTRCLKQSPVSVDRLPASLSTSGATMPQEQGTESQFAIFNLQIRNLPITNFQPTAQTGTHQRPLPRRCRGRFG